jgi:hypothetical protein
VESKVEERGGRHKIQISEYTFYGAWAYGAPQIFFRIFYFCRKNLDFAVTFYSFSNNVVMVGGMPSIAAVGAVTGCESFPREHV